MSLEVESLSLSSSLQWLPSALWLVATELRRSSRSRLKCVAAYSTRSDGRFTRTLTVKSISRLLSSAGISYCEWDMMNASMWEWWWWRMNLKRGETSRVESWRWLTALTSIRFDSLQNDCQRLLWRVEVPTDTDHCCAQLLLPTVQMRKNVQKQ